MGVGVGGWATKAPLVWAGHRQPLPLVCWGGGWAFEMHFQCSLDATSN